MRTLLPSSIPIPETLDAVNAGVVEPENTVSVPASKPPASPSSECAAVRRHALRRSQAGTLRGTTREVAARLRAEGVPISDIGVVATEIERCTRLLAREGPDVLCVRLHPWTTELVERYGDKLCTLLMTARGKVEKL